MNDVLAKPFTKEGMIRILKKHLPYMLKNPPLAGEDGTPNGGPSSLPGGSTPGYSGGGGSVGGGPGPGGMTLAPPMAGPGAAVKFDNSPMQSPATTSSWHSPTQNMAAQHASPTMDGAGGGYLAHLGGGGGAGGAGQMVMGGGPQRQHQQHQQQHQHHYGGPPPTGQMGGMSRMQDGMSRGDERPEKRARLYAQSGGYA
jgi:osomolarity two-component system response regulator SKN7